MTTPAATTAQAGAATPAAVTLTATRGRTPSPTRAKGHRLLTTAVGGRGAGVTATCACGTDYPGTWTGQRDHDRLRNTHQAHLREVRAAQRDVRANATNARGKYVETAEYFGMMRRIARGAAKRTGQMDPGSLAELSKLIDELRAFETEAALQLNRDGYSWTAIADAQGICRQNAHRKYAQGSGRGSSRKGTIAKGTNTRATS
jgi:hypothetical protein